MSHYSLTAPLRSRWATRSLTTANQRNWSSRFSLRRRNTRIDRHHEPQQPVNMGGKQVSTLK